MPPPRLRARLDRITPYQQGDLDGLCGIYSILNAAKIVCPELGHTEFLTLFRVLMKRLSRTDMLLEVLDHGMEIATLHAMVRVTQNHLRSEHGIRIGYRTYAAPVSDDVLDDLWTTMRDRTEEGCARR